MNNQIESLPEFQLSPIEQTLSLWPAPCGLYVVSGLMEMVPSLERMLIRHWHHLGPIYWIDSGNYFNAYQLAEIARSQKQDPMTLLRSIKIARPFTAFQFQQMLGKIPLGVPTPLIVISDLLSLFFDPELQEFDLQRAFRDFLIRLRHVKQNAVVLSLLLPSCAPPERQHLTDRVTQLADYYYNTVPLLQ